MAKYQNTHKIIQWNCRGYKANYNKLQLLITEQNPTVICLQETLKKSNDKTNMKNYEQYDYIHDTGLRALGGVSILIRKNIPQSKINISTPPTSSSNFSNFTQNHRHLLYIHSPSRPYKRRTAK